MRRRRLLQAGVALATTTLAGCNWWSSDPIDADAAPAGGTAPSSPSAPSPVAPPAPAPSPSAVWSPQVPAMIVGSGATFDLKVTLPLGAPQAGTFGIDPAGAALPAGMTLSPKGVLSVGNATIGSVGGVVFTYEPA